MKPVDNKTTSVFLRSNNGIGFLVFLIATLLNVGCSGTPKRELNYVPGKGWAKSTIAANLSELCTLPADAVDAVDEIK